MKLAHVSRKRFFGNLLFNHKKLAFVTKVMADRNTQLFDGFEWPNGDIVTDETPIDSWLTGCYLVLEMNFYKIISLTVRFFKHARKVNSANHKVKNPNWQHGINLRKKSQNCSASRWLTMDLLKLSLFGSILASTSRSRLKSVTPNWRAMMSKTSNEFFSACSLSRVSDQALHWSFVMKFFAAQPSLISISAVALVWSMQDVYELKTPDTDKIKIGNHEAWYKAEKLRYDSKVRFLNTLTFGFWTRESNERLMPTPMLIEFPRFRPWTLTEVQSPNLDAEMTRPQCRLTDAKTVRPFLSPAWTAIGQFSWWYAVANWPK